VFSLRGIAQAAVIGVPDERMGEVAQGLRRAPCRQHAHRAEVIDWCRRNMANYKVPRSVEVVDALPLNAAGKVLKTALRERTG
jgi:acyl-CoA synthetase (AMP-forming)/AMP-acid ligase II